MTFDADKAFPVGCGVELPFCADAYPIYVQTCTCEMFPGTDALTWICPV